eukprot:scpid52334/ scgid11593/ 
MGRHESIKLSKSPPRRSESGDGGGRAGTYKSASSDRSRTTVSGRRSSQPGTRSVSVKGIRNFRTLPESVSSSARSSNGSVGAAGSGSGSHGNDSYIGRISRGGLCMFLLALTATAFITTFPFYMVFTVYGPIQLAVYSGDAESTVCSNTWCSTLSCHDTTTATDGDNSTAVVRVANADDVLRPHQREVTWPAVELQRGGLHELILPVSDSSDVALSAYMTGGCAVVTVFLFSSQADLQDWKATGKSRWLDRHNLECEGDTDWGVEIASGGSLVVALNVESVSADVYLSLSGTVVSQTVHNSTEYDVVCATLDTPCSVPLHYRDKSQLVVIARAQSQPAGGILATIKCTCTARAGLYVAVFGGSNVFVILLLVAIYSYRQRHRWKIFRTLRQRSDNAADGEDQETPTPPATQINATNHTESTLLLAQA